MTAKRYMWIVMVIGMLAAMCGTAGAGMGIIAETHETSVGEYLTCTPPCECISEATAALRWGAAGYERCSKTICGQTSDASVQYYCIHQVGSTAATTAPLTTTEPPAVPTTAAAATTAPATVPQKTPVDPALVIAAVALALPAAARAGRK